jgi:hypothetical protein
MGREIIAKMSELDVCPAPLAGASYAGWTEVG